MPDIVLEAVPAFPAAARAFGDAGSAGVIAEERSPGLATVMVRHGAEKRLATAARKTYGIDLPAGPKRVAAKGISFIGTGPGRWLAVMEDGAPKPAALAAALGDTASVADQSDGFAVLRLSGPRVRDALAKGLPVDLHQSVFKPGDAAATSAMHIGLTIWQIDDAPTYDIAMFRSFAGSFWHWVAESSAEFGLAVRG